MAWPWGFGSLTFGRLSHFFFFFESPGRLFGALNTQHYCVLVMWKCSICEYEDNEAEEALCGSCGEGERPPPSSAAASTAGGLVIAKILTIAPVPNKDKLRIVSLDIGAAAAPITVVTNATVYADTLVVAALPGATVWLDGEDTLVKAATVGGVHSQGMLCDCPMLRWKGGAAGAAATVPASAGLKPGDAAPDARPRGE